MNPHHRHPVCKTVPMNFFHRRKFLKKVNTLELTPLRLLGHKAGEGAKVSVLLPRFRGVPFGVLLQTRTRRKFIPIRLDEFGSATWLLIDGETSVGGICGKLTGQFPELASAGVDLEERVATFMFLLYDQRYITFREIMENP
jgi:hypothetical protein